MSFWEINRDKIQLGLLKIHSREETADFYWHQKAFVGYRIKTDKTAVVFVMIFDWLKSTLFNLH